MNILGLALYTVLFFVLMVVGIIFLVSVLPTSLVVPVLVVVASIFSGVFVKFLNKKSSESSVADREGGSVEEVEVFKLVGIIFSHFKEAVVVAIATTVYILIFVAVVAVPLSYFVFQFPIVPTVLYLAAFAIVLGLVSFISSLINEGNRYQSYTGDPTGTTGRIENLAEQKIVVSAGGIGGLLTLKQDMISSVTKTNPTTITLDTVGNPKGFPAFLSKGVLTLHFMSDEDATRFEKATHLWKSVRQRKSLV